MVVGYHGDGDVKRPQPGAPEIGPITYNSLVVQW